MKEELEVTTGHKVLASTIVLTLLTGYLAFWATVGYVFFLGIRAI